MKHPEIESLKADVGRLETQVRSLQEQLRSAQEAAKRSRAMADAAVATNAGVDEKVGAAASKVDELQRDLDNARAAHRSELKRAHDREEELARECATKDRRIAELLGKGGVVKRIVRKVRGGK